MTHGVEKMADAAAAISIPAWFISVAAETLPIVQWLAGAVAIVAGLVTIIVHVRKARSGA